MIKPDKIRIHKSLGKDKLFTPAGLKNFTPREQKKIEEIRPILKNLINHIIEQELKEYLDSVYAKK